VLEVLITLAVLHPADPDGHRLGHAGQCQVGTINLVWRWLTGSESTLVDVYSYGGVIWQ